MTPEIKLLWIVLILVCVVMLIVIIYLTHLDYVYNFKPDNQTDYSKAVNHKNAVVIVPEFTANAYAKNGFYDYYLKSCLTCNTVKINPVVKYSYTSSVNGIKILSDLNYTLIADSWVHEKPEILQSYSTVIILHNEYVTKEMFNAITSHPNVIFLYPNALYVEIGYDNHQINLIRGHGYPTNLISNGFDWQYDNTDPFEYDKKCETWKFNNISNGHMLNCYPDPIIKNNINLLIKLQELVK